MTRERSAYYRLRIPLSLAMGSGMIAVQADGLSFWGRMGVFAVAGILYIGSEVALASGVRFIVREWSKRAA